MGNKWTRLSSLTKFLIGICVGIIIMSSAGVVIGGAETSWKFGKHNSNNSIVLDKNHVINDINKYLHKKSWYDKVWIGDWSTDRIIFSVEVNGKSDNWTAILTPNNEDKTNAPVINVKLDWKIIAYTKELNSAISKSYNSNPASRPPNLTKEKIANDIKSYLDKTSWYDKIWLGNWSTSKVMFSVEVNGELSNWTVILTPAHQDKTNAPIININLEWITIENNNDLSAAIGLHYNKNAAPANKSFAVNINAASFANNYDLIFTTKEGNFLDNTYHLKGYICLKVNGGASITFSLNNQKPSSWESSIILSAWFGANYKMTIYVVVIVKNNNINFQILIDETKICNKNGKKMNPLAFPINDFYVGSLTLLNFN